MQPADDLAAFQAALLALLAEDLPGEALSRRLREDAAFVGHREYVEGFESRMLAVAAELVKKWGRPNTNEPLSCDATKREKKTS